MTVACRHWQPHMHGHVHVYVHACIHTRKHTQNAPCQGRIASYMMGDEPLGPLRVWLRDMNVPGLCMTRSFGDAVAATVGVIDEPEVVAHSITKDDR